MPFRARFECLWCGRTWDTRSDDDLEGWATLCPECLGRADDNGFLRGRLRTGLRERAAAVSGVVSRAVSGAGDDWYLRRGRFARGPLHDGPWQMELDEVIRWADELPVRGTIVELGAGTGWWSALLADRGELWCYEADQAALEVAQRRLVAHARLAHLHLRDPLAPAERAADVVFAAFLLGRAEDVHGLRERLGRVAAWLRPGGDYAFVEVAPGEVKHPVDGPAGPLWPRAVDELREALSGAGLEPVELRTTHRAFVVGRARRTA